MKFLAIIFKIRARNDQNRRLEEINFKDEITP